MPHVSFRGVPPLHLLHPLVIHLAAFPTQIPTKAQADSLRERAFDAGPRIQRVTLGSDWVAGAELDCVLVDVDAVGAVVEVVLVLAHAENDLLQNLSKKE